MSAPLSPKQIEFWPLAQLKPYARNAKTHDVNQVAKIAASMAEFGWTVPVLVAADGELIAGHAVRGIALEIDSFGGEVAGVFDLADAIRAARKAKPVWAFVTEQAFSAGDALASQADRIILPRTGAVGSIGVVVMHADLSGQLSDAGVAVTLIHSGAHKVDGNPYAPLPDPVRARIQGEIDSIRTLFAQILFRMARNAPAKHCGIRSETGLIHAYEGAGVIEEPWSPIWARKAAFAFHYPE